MTISKMRGMRPLVLAFLSAVALPLGGCCSLAQAWCGPERSAWISVEWGTPELATRTLLEALRRDDPEIVYEALADEMRASLGIDGLGDAVCHSLGNPHAVVFVDDAEAVNLPRLGPLAETSPLFPDRVNLSVVSRMDDGSFRMRVWERGVGITMACGSGTCAVGVAVARRGLGGDANRIVMDGGSVTIEWDRETTHVTMTGPVAHVCHGSLSAGLAGLLEPGDVRP